MDKANIPRTWLMTDERMDGALLAALDRVPEGGGVVFRHHSLDPEARRSLASQVARTCRARNLVLAVSRDGALAHELGADLVHNPLGGSRGLPISLAVHSLDQAIEANARAAMLAFVSPVRATSSHPGHVPLSRNEIRMIVEELDCPAIALGGMDAQRFADLGGLGFHGWAGIDAWLRI